jgi:hypothetical protein
MAHSLKMRHVDELDAVLGGALSPFCFNTLKRKCYEKKIDIQSRNRSSADTVLPIDCFRWS